MIDRLSGASVAALAWAFFFSALALEALLDWSMRTSDGDVHGGGLGRSLWLTLHLVLALPAIAALVLSARRLHWPLAIPVVAAQLAIGACL
jgi:hypothetical protein